MDTGVAIVWDEERTQGDWQITPSGELLTAPLLESAIMVSLFTDARADAGDKLPPGQLDPRGFWGDALEETPLGSKLWLLERSKREPETLRRAREYILAALAWLIEDELVARIDVAPEWVSPARMGAVITIHQGDGRAAALRADWAWQGI